MQIISTIADTRDAIARAREDGARIGFVPTMGALHRGHTSLVEHARRETDMVVMSIFVNPLQFAPNEDLSKYPRPIENDERMATEAGVDILFTPEVAEMYPPGATVTLKAGPLSTDWEGKSRPGHFDGVLTVVAKLFNIVQPDVAVFGRKDLQQATLVKAMVRDLDMPLRVILGDIVRESDGLALSSRNKYLNESERQQATTLSRTLEAVRTAFAEGVRGADALEAAGLRQFATDGMARLDYLGIVNPDSFVRPANPTATDVAVIAARVGTTRLIDNKTLGE
jgi:pantoate--beta-alanine ligase